MRVDWSSGRRPGNSTAKLQESGNRDCGAMCGIVGILGKTPVAMQVVDALKRLEYRGYDSAGVATLEHGRLERRRAEGKLRNLEIKLSQAPLSGAIGIGHTPRATHRKPNETNPPPPPTAPPPGGPH